MNQKRLSILRVAFVVKFSLFRVREQSIKFEVVFLKLDILDVDSFLSVFLNHRRDFLGYVGNRLDAEDTRIISGREGLNEDLVERYSQLVFEVNAVELAVGGSGAFHRLAVLALFGHLVVAISISLVRQRWKSRLALPSIGRSDFTTAKSE